MKVSIDLHDEVSLSKRTENRTQANLGRTPQQGRLDIAALYAKSNAPDIRASGMLDNFICAKKCDSSIVLAQNDTFYCCLPLF